MTKIDTKEIRKLNLIDDEIIKSFCDAYDEAQKKIEKLKNLFIKYTESIEDHYYECDVCEDLRLEILKELGEE